MRPIKNKLLPFACAGICIVFVGLLQVLPRFWPEFHIIDRLEWMSYDWRMRLAESDHPGTSNQLGFVYIGDDAIDLFSSGALGTNLQFGLYWPRQVYGRVVRELKAQGAKAVAFDILFGERRPDHPPTPTPEGLIPSDRFFQRQLQAAGNVILGATKEVVPDELFRFSAASIGDISIERDSDGVLRRVKAFHDYRIWHPQIRAEARLNDWDLVNAQVETNRIIIPVRDKKPVLMEVTEEGYFDPATLHPATKPAAGFVRLQKAFENVRVWHLGIQLAATELNLDLENARWEPDRLRILFSGSNGVARVLPVDRQGRFLIDWNLRHQSLTREAFEKLVVQDLKRQSGEAPGERFKNKLVVIGSVASGNDLSDRGATPLEKDTFLTSNNWNVANAMLSGRFIRICPDWATLLLLAGLGISAAVITLRLRIVAASMAVACAAALVVWGAVWLFTHYRFWLPLVTPLCVLLMTHFVLVSYQAIFEQGEKRRIKNVFSRIVSPEVVQELLKVEDLALVGARRPITVMFTDVRGFTEVTELMHSRVEEYARKHNLTPAETQASYDASAKEVLQMVNQYLGLIAETVKKHEGTLDKYIGDCVMAFWGAPASNEKHALACVRAAVDSQRAIEALNQQRAAENQMREKNNPTRAAQGLEPLPPLELLSLGTGISSGVLTVGLMGSDAHIVNYTVFGREVNLAARLEPISGRGHIIISEATHQELLRHDPALAKSCIRLEPIKLKGFQIAVGMYEVPWRTDA